MSRKKSQKQIRLGVVGVQRGLDFVRNAPLVGMQLVALCDKWEEKLQTAGQKLGVATYTDYDSFLEHDMDAVILANYFHEHAPFAIKALRAGKHVMSETAACKTMAEAVALCREVERSNKIYMFEENYAYTRFSLELTRLYQRGEIGEVMYGEGEYNHPFPIRDILRLSPGQEHWRNYVPSTYYCTHALAPLMTITDTMPVSVNALSIAFSGPRMDVRRNDPGGVILCRMNNGAVFRLFGGYVPGHSIWYRLHGTRGLMETTRGNGYFGPGLIRVAIDPWESKPTEMTERTYLPKFPAWAKKAGDRGHGGGDYVCTHHFAECIRKGTQPYLDVYRGIAMSVVGILAWRSALENGIPYQVPDFRKDMVRRKYANDHWSPFPEDRRPGQPPASIKGNLKPTKKALALARMVWDEMGYREN